MKCCTNYSCIGFITKVSDENLPYIYCGILIWGKACKTYLEKIHKLQKWAVIILSNSHYRSRSVPLFQKYDVLDVYDS